MKSQSSSTSRKRISSEDALALWREYKATGDQQVRNRLVMTYAPLVKYIVFKKVRELPARCEVEDFISCGLEALIASIDRYDPEKGATLEQFAWTRIHGAVLDELRRQDWAPRSLRRWERDISRAREQFTGIHGRRPSREELADSLSITVEDLRRREDDIAVSDVTSLNTLVISDDETTVERIDTLAGTEVDGDPEHSAMSTEAKHKFRRAFETLPKREREVAVLLYVKNLTLREIGEILGVSESRVCQIHSQLKRTLKAQLTEDALLFSRRRLRRIRENFPQVLPGSDRSCRPYGPADRSSQLHPPSRARQATRPRTRAGTGVLAVACRVRTRPRSAASPRCRRRTPCARSTVPRRARTSCGATSASCTSRWTRTPGA